MLLLTKSFFVTCCDGDGGQFAEAPKTGSDPRPPPIVGPLFGVFFMLCWPTRVVGSLRADLAAARDGRWRQGRRKPLRVFYTGHKNARFKHQPFALAFVFFFQNNRKSSPTALSGKPRLPWLIKPLWSPLGTTQYVDTKHKLTASYCNKLDGISQPYHDHNACVKVGEGMSG